MINSQPNSLNNDPNSEGSQTLAMPKTDSNGAGSSSAEAAIAAALDSSINNLFDSLQPLKGISQLHNCEEALPPSHSHFDLT